MKWTLGLGLIAITAAAACGDDSSGSGGGQAGGAGSGGSAAATSGGGPGDVARGQYLVDTVLVCGHCHTPSDQNGTPDISKYLAGSRSYDFTTDTGEVVSVYAENLTPSPEQGVGTWTDEMIRTAIIGGSDDDDVSLWPIMPYPEYALLSEDDVGSIVKYLRTIGSSENVVASDTLPNPYPPAPPISDAQIPMPTLDATDPAHDSALRGRYLAAVACVQCHTPELSPGNPDFAGAFAGGRTYTSRSDLAPSTSTNLTPSSSGLGEATVEEIAAAMKANTSTTGAALCKGAPHKMSGMTDGDLIDIANYLHALPPIESGPFQCEE